MEPAALNPQRPPTKTSLSPNWTVAVKQLATPVIGLAIGVVLDLPPAHAAPVGIALALRHAARNSAIIRKIFLKLSSNTNR
jgi:hypothetical protein